MHGHFIEKCSKCGVVIKQCRCMGPKAESFGVCIGCTNKKQAAQIAGAHYPGVDEFGGSDF